ncbi:MAG: tRNA pseudouridine(38-40) synthase TruA, partial [Longimicrobiales bacterium]
NEYRDFRSIRNGPDTAAGRFEARLGTGAGPRYLFAVDASESLRFRLTIHYDGAAFHGWQVQPDQRTVQGDLEAALSKLADAPRSVIGSGRTDSGVHATGQVASVDMPVSWDVPRLRKSLNAVLSDDLWIEAIARAAPDFHPRYDALDRTYRYEVGLKAECASPFFRRWCWPLGGSGSPPPTVDRALLGRAASAIVGEHSFEAFAKTGQPERGTRCHVHAAQWSETDLGVRFTVTADRYLHHMVRYLTGTMIDIGCGRRPVEDMARLLASPDQLTTSPPAPPEGLFLHRVRYPGDDATTTDAYATTERTRSPLLQ